MTLNAVAGVLSGTPTTAGVYPVTIVLANVSGGHVAVPVTVTVSAPGSTALVGDYTDAAGSLGAPLTVASPITAGGPALSATLVDGVLPPGMTLNPDGSVTGVPTVSGTYRASIILVNASGGRITLPVVLTVNIAGVTTPLTVAYSDLAAEAGVAIAPLGPVVVNGPAKGAQLVNGSLPVGLTLDSATGVITGTPTTKGLYELEIRLCNASGACTIVPVDITVHQAALGVAYSNQTMTQGMIFTSPAPVVNNAMPGATTTYTVTSGTLPAGLVLNVNGTISGTPTTAGVTSFTVTATNSGRTATSSPTYTVLAPPTAALAANPLIAYTGTAATVTPTFTIPGGGGSATINQGINGGAAVTTGTGYSTGIHNTTGTTTYTLTVVNSLGVTATVTVDVKWVSNTATLNITNTGSTSVHTATNDPDSPLFGLEVVVPNQSAYDQSHSILCSGDTSLTVTRETSLTVGTPLPAGVYDYSHSFNFISTVGYPFRVPVTVTLPYDPSLAAGNALGAGDVPMPFYWDASYGKWVATGLKAVDTSAHTVTFTTLLPGRYAVLGIPGLATNVASNLSPAFVNGTDEWLQWNQGVFNHPGGSSLGMSSLASWYFPLWKTNAGNTHKQNTGLHDVFDTFSNVDARALISRLANGTLENWGQIWDQRYTSGSGRVNYGLTDAQTGLALITSLKVTGQP